MFEFSLVKGFFTNSGSLKKVVFNIESIILLFIGLFSGAYGILVGAGGGFILVPALLIILDMSPEMAAGTGLFVVFLNAASGVASFIKQKRIDFSLSWYILIGALPGSFIGVYFTKLISPAYFNYVFAGMLIILALYLFWKNSGKNQPAAVEGEVTLTPKVKVSLLFIGVLMGTVSTFFGIGGGWLMVPILMYLYKVVPHRATATSLFSLCLYSIFGVVIHLSQGHIDWSAAIWAGVGAIIGAQVGAYISKRISGKLIIQLLSILLLVIGGKMLF